MPSISRHRRLLTTTLLTVVTLTVVACAAGSASSPSPTGPGSSPSVRPTPTPIGITVGSPAEAAALVIATDPRFAGAIQLTPDVIGASTWWTASSLSGGGFQVEMTVGWGDCPAGCIERHTWTYEVGADGAVKLLGEAGDQVPETLPQ